MQVKLTSGRLGGGRCDDGVHSRPAEVHALVLGVEAVVVAIATGVHEALAALVRRVVVPADVVASARACVGVQLAHLWTGNSGYRSDTLVDR